MTFQLKPLWKYDYQEIFDKETLKHLPVTKFKKWHSQFDKNDRNPLGAQERAILHPMEPASKHSNKLLNRGKKPRIDTVPQQQHESAKSDFYRKKEAEHRNRAKQYPEGGRMHQDEIVRAEMYAKKAVNTELKNPANAETRHDEGILNINWGSNLSGKNLKWKTKSGERWHPVGDGKDRGGRLKEALEAPVWIHRKPTTWDIQKWARAGLDEGFWEGDEKQRKDELAKANEDPEYRKLAREAYDTRHDSAGADNHKAAEKKAKELGFKTLADYHAHIAKSIELRTAEVNQPPKPETRKENS